MRRAAATVLGISGLAAGAAAQTANVIVTTSALTVSAGDAFTVSVTATGSDQIFGYNLLIFASHGAEYVTFSNLVHNPSGSTSIFGAPAGPGIDGTTVDTRDISAGILIQTLPIDNLTFFSFTVTISDSWRSDAIVFSSAAGSGTAAALTYPTPQGIIITGTDYPEIHFGGFELRIPAPTGGAALLIGSAFAARRRRSRRAIHDPASAAMRCSAHVSFWTAG